MFDKIEDCLYIIDRTILFAFRRFSRRVYRLTFVLVLLSLILSVEQLLLLFPFAYFPFEKHKKSISYTNPNTSYKVVQRLSNLPTKLCLTSLY